MFLNVKLVGNVDYKNPKIAFGVNTGTNKLLVKNNTFEKELNLNITNEKLIFHLEITENWSTNGSTYNATKFIIGLKIEFLISYALTFVSMTIIENKNVTFLLILPSIILISLGSKW